MTDKHWITFDLDNTIMKNPFGQHVFPEIEMLIKEATGYSGDVMELILDEHLIRMNNGEILASYDWDDIVKKLLADMNCDLEIDVEKLVLKHSVTSKIYLLEENMIADLIRIKEQGYLIAAATNGYYKYQMPVIRALELDRVFDEIVTSDKAGCGKPDVEFLKDLKDKGILAAHVGDRIDHDIVMANELNVVSVFINNKLPEEVMQLTVDERKNSEIFIELYKDKWIQENKFRNDPFCNNLLPDVVVHSIHELAENIGCLGNLQKGRLE